MDDKTHVTSNIPPGGRTGQALTKANNKDYNVKWSYSTGGSGGGSVDSISIADINKIVKG